MCGIFGTYNLNISEEKITQCMEKIRHRGPDGSGIWKDDLCGLAHRRLSILDLSDTGKQPMATADERYFIVYNGEVYNFIELREELQAAGYCFRSNTDTEVVLNAYIEWKEKCLDKFNGMWAFAIYDRYEKTLFLARDRFGVKPLFYTKIAEGIAFASEMKALTPVLPSVTPNYNILKDINQYFNYEATEACLLNEISRLPAGHYAYVDKNGMHIKRWWKTLENLMHVPDRYEEQTEMFRELFLDACKIRMRSDVTIGTALSGGLDSSATICAMADIIKKGAGARVNHDFQHAFVAAFPGTMLDETYYAREVTDYLNIESTEVVIDPVTGLNKLPDYIYDFEDIYITSPVPMMQLYSQIKQNGVTVTLDGHGADELFGGYPGDMIYALLDVGVDKTSIKQILTTYFGMTSKAIAAKQQSYGKCYIDFIVRHLAKKILHVPTWDRLIDRECQEDFNKLGHFEKVLYNSTHTSILPTLLRNYDRYSMASGVEIRMPFLDYRLVQFAFSISWKAKLHGGYSKSIIRDALKDIMPKGIVERKSKIGFNTPIVEWMKGPWREWMQDTVAGLDFKQSKVVDPVRTKDMVDKVIMSSETSYSEGEKAWEMLMPYLWERYFLKAI
ncbi:MAG: asparagine synthase (glutamine-hydrolyzing) [Ruminococcus sp.]|nr:asparagine synthase (glutamine-hydrolyzing) [Ruminococcus sp.]